MNFQWILTSGDAVWTTWSFSEILGGVPDKNSGEKKKASETDFSRFLDDFWYILGLKWVKRPFQKGVDF